MTAPPAPLDRAVEEARTSIATWNTCCRQHDNECVCGAWTMENAIVSLLAALDADKRLERAGRVLREIEKFCSCSDHECPAAIARRYFAERGERNG